MPLGGNRRVARRTARRTSRRQGMFSGNEAGYDEPQYTESENSNEPTEADQINELFELKEKGIITEEEFAEKKKQILGL